MSTTKAAKAPTHRVYAVNRENPGDKAYWQSVGALWAHEDGEGFNLRLELLPLNGADLVIRKVKPKAPDVGDAA